MSPAGGSQPRTYAPGRTYAREGVPTREGVRRSRGRDSLDERVGHEPTRRVSRDDLHAVLEASPYRHDRLTSEEVFALALAWRELTGRDPSPKQAGLLQGGARVHGVAGGIALLRRLYHERHGDLTNLLFDWRRTPPEPVEPLSPDEVAEAVDDDDRQGDDLRARFDAWRCPRHPDLPPSMHFDGSLFCGRCEGGTS